MTARSSVPSIRRWVSVADAPAVAEIAMSGMLIRRPEAHFNRNELHRLERRAHRQMVAMLVGERDLELRLLPHAHHGERVLLKQFAGPRQLRAGLRSLEKRTPQHVFKAFNSRGNCGLRDVHLARGIDETAGLGNHQKGACEADIHGV